MLENPITVYIMFTYDISGRTATMFKPPRSEVARFKKPRLEVRVFAKKLKLKPRSGSDEAFPGLWYGPNHPVNFLGGPEAYYSDPERFITVADAIEVLARFFPPGFAKTFLLTEIVAGRLRVAGVPWVIERTPAFLLDTPEGEQGRSDSPYGQQVPDGDAKWMSDDSAMEIELEYDEHTVGHDAYIDFDKETVTLPSQFEEYGKESETIEIWTNQIRFRRSVIEAYVDGARTSSASRDRTSSGASAPQRRTAGRKPHPATDRVWAELARRAYRSEFETDAGPISQAEACRAMSAWLAKNGLEMSDETLRDKVRALWSVLGWR